MVENFIDFCSRSALLMGWGKREKKKKKKEVVEEEKMEPAWDCC